MTQHSVEFRTSMRLAVAEALLTWCVHNAGECLLDHPARLAAIREFLAMPINLDQDTANE